MELIKKKNVISISEVKEILGKHDPESMDQIQRWTYDFATKFAKVDPKDAQKELRSFTFGWKKLILAETLEKILQIIQK